MAREFVGEDLSDSQWRDVDLSRATIRESTMSGARLLGLVAHGLEIDGLLSDVVINGVPVMPLVEAELDRMHPERLLLRSREPAGLREGWAWLGRHWQTTEARVTALSPPDRDRRVDDEWSAIETLRHLVFVTDAWFTRAVLGRARAFHPIGLAGEFIPHQVEMGIDPAARPALEDVLDVRRAQRAEVADFLAALQPEDLDVRGWTPTEPGWPIDPSERTVLQCLHTVLNEEWAHRGFCERDLDRLDKAAP